MTVLSTVFIFGCSTAIHQKNQSESATANLEKDEAFQKGLREAYFDIGHRNLLRSPAEKGQSQLREVAFNVELLRSFKVLVFPKYNNQVEKSNEEIYDPQKLESLSPSERRQVNSSLENYQSPFIFQFRAVELQSCYKLIQMRPKFKPEMIFGKKENFGDNQAKKCVVLEGKVDDLRRKDIRKDDILALRIYFDENFIPYGKAIDLALESKNKENFRTVLTRIDPSKSFSSELSLFPIDVPNFLSYLPSKNWKAIGENVFVPHHPVVKRNLQKFKVSSSCKTGLYETNFKDDLNRFVSINWCKNDPWPTMIETNNSYSVLLK